MLRPSSIFIPVFIFGALSSVAAHHGQDFLLVQDSTPPSLWSGTAFSSFEWSKYGSTDELSLESGLSVGIAPHVSLGASVSFADEGQGWDYQSVAPSLQILLTPKTWPVRIAVMGGYSFGNGSSTESVSTITETTITSAPQKKTKTVVVQQPDSTNGGTDDPAGPCGPEYGPDAPPCEDVTSTTQRSKIKKGAVNRSTARHANHTTSNTVTKTVQVKGSTSKTQTVKVVTHAEDSDNSDAGIHRHGENHAFGRLIVETDVTEADTFIFNLIGVSPEEGKPGWGYAAAWRHRFSHQWAIGLETIGNLVHSNEHEAVAGLYWAPAESAMLKVGCGLGLTEASPDFSLRAGLIWRF